MRNETDVEKRFEGYLRQGLPGLKSRGYTPTYFLQMLAEEGGVGTAHILLLGKRHEAAGLVQLWSMGELASSLEYAALLPWFVELFSDEELETARERLIALDFDVDRNLRSAVVPSWWAAAPDQ